MSVHSESVYRKVLATQRLPQGIGVVSLARLAVAFSQMAKDLRSQGGPPEQQSTFQTAIAHAAESALHLTASERTAVQSTLATAFDGVPRNFPAMAVRADFLRQVRFPRNTGSFGSVYAGDRQGSEHVVAPVQHVRTRQVQSRYPRGQDPRE